MATAAPNYTVDGLVTSLRTKYIQPTSQNLYADADVALFLDEALRDTVVPLIMSVQESYWVSYLDQAVTGAASYTIPPAWRCGDAHGRGVRGPYRQRNAIE
jgi:hypothetical protein